MKRTIPQIYLFLLSATLSFAQVQDTALNNLVHPSGYKTCPLGELGSVKKYGHAKPTMILVPGIGFGSAVFESFIAHYKSSYTIYAITPAGFGGTSAPPMPEAGVKYAERSWTNGIVTGILNLIEKENLSKPVIVGHFVTGTQVAFSLAINYPDKIGSAIIIGGAPYRYYASPKNGSYTEVDWEKELVLTPEKRSAVTELYWAPKWFKTVTQKTWDDNMWTPEDYCRDSIAGKRLFQTSAAVPLPVMIRYLIEWGAYDANEKYKQIKVPMLILVPDFKGILMNDAKDTSSCKSPTAKAYLNYYHKDIWIKAKQAGNPMLQFETIPDTRIFMWYDHPRATYKTIKKFLKR